VLKKFVKYGLSDTGRRKTNSRIGAGFFGEPAGLDCELKTREKHEGRALARIINVHTLTFSLGRSMVLPGQDRRIKAAAEIVDARRDHRIEER